jgi:5-dehydro-2-deoxygluconokinase
LQTTTATEENNVSPGYDGKLYILAFDHRGSFQKKLFGIEADPTPDQVEAIADAKLLIYEGLELAVTERGLPAEQIGVLVDEQFGAAVEIPTRAKAKGLKLAMPVEKSGQDEFDFEYGDDFGAHIERFDPDFIKVLVRYNPDTRDAAANVRQLLRLRRLSEWLLAHNRKFLFELLVPATDEHLSEVGGDVHRYDVELRPALIRRAIEAIQHAGIEVDIWKIEGVDDRDDAACIARQTRNRGRDDVVCVLLGRGASDEKVDEWLRQAAPVPGFVGFAIGRSIWWRALKGYLDRSLQREQAAHQIASNYLRFVGVYEDAERGAMVR